MSKAYIPNPEVLNEIDRKLRRYTLESKLEVIRKIAVCIDPLLDKKVMHKSIFIDGDLPKKWYPHGSAGLFELEYLALRATILGEWDGQLSELNRLKDYRKIANLYRSYKPPFTNKRDDTTLKENEAIISLLFNRLSLQQFKYQNYPLDGLYRHNWFFKYSNKEIDISKTFIEVFKYPYEDYLTFSFSYQMLSNLLSSELDFTELANNLCKGKIFTFEKLTLILDKLSMDRELAISKYERYKCSDDNLRIYNYDPYTLRPILRYKEKLFNPIPRLLNFAITEGFLNYTFAEKGIEFRNLFGEHVFFDYLHELLKEEKSIDTIIPEFIYMYRRQELKSPDYILVQDDKIILLEAKATSPTISLITATIDEYINQLEKAYGKGVVQCIKKERHIKDKVMIHDKLPLNINKIYYLVVTLEDFRFPVDFYLRAKIEEYCKTKGVELESGRNFHAMSVHTLESIIENDNRDLFAFLEDREESGNVFKTYIETDINQDRERNKLRDFIFWDSNIRRLSIDLFGKDI